MSGRFCDAINVARDLHRRLDSRSPVKSGEQKPVQLFPLIDLLSADLTASQNLSDPYRILIEKTPLLARLYGMYLRFEDKAEISISASLNTCWSRFVTCKELMHLVCDSSKKHYATDPLNQINSALSRHIPRSKEDELNSEDFAFYAACEFLYPWETRFKAEQAELTRYQMADKFKIPEKVIDLYLLDGHGELSEQTNSGIVLAAVSP